MPLSRSQFAIYLYQSIYYYIEPGWYHKTMDEKLRAVSITFVSQVNLKELLNWKGNSLVTHDKYDPPVMPFVLFCLKAWCIGGNFQA